MKHASVLTRHRWRTVQFLLAIVVLVGLAAWQFRPPMIAVTAIVRGEAVDAIYATGSVEPAVMVPLALRVGGRLAERKADEGDQVRKGQLLARLDDTDLASTVEEQRARVDFARRQNGRTGELAARGFVSRGETERTQAELLASEAALRRVQAQRDQLALFAPADGTIIRRDGEAGQYIAPGQPIFVMACCAPLRVSAEIDEEDISRVKVGQQVVLKADAFPGQVFDGTVSEVTPKGDPVSRSYRVRIALAAPGALQTGMTVDANLLVARRNNAMLLAPGVVRDGAVWIIDDGRLRRRTVQTGSRGNKYIEIKSGLNGGERVALQPDESYADGRRVRIETP